MCTVFRDKGRLDLGVSRMPTSMVKDALTLFAIQVGD
jgi:hypothetical protein